MARGKKKAAPKRYTLLWFLELLFYGFYWNGVVSTRLLAYIDPIDWLFWFFPSLKQRYDAWYYKGVGMTYEENIARTFDDPVSGFNNWYAGYTIVTFFSCLFFGFFHLFCGFIQINTYGSIPLITATVWPVAAFIISEYLEWNNRHLPYFKEFERMSRSRKRWLGWLCTLLLLFSFLFAFFTMSVLPHSASHRKYRPYKRWWRGFTYHEVPPLPLVSG